MRNIVGIPARGENYFVRKGIEKKLYRRLKSSDNLYLSAPRRVGKTSLMYRLEDTPESGYNFIYISVEAVRSSEEFFFRLLDLFSKKKVLEKKGVISESFQNVAASFIDRFRKVSIAGFSLELDSNDPTEKFYTEYEELLEFIKTDQKIIVMIDEFPSAIQNIRKNHGDQIAIEFLQKNRSIRQNSKSNIIYIYTGSIGLPAIVRDLDVSESINDLNSFELGPFSVDEAKSLAISILNYEKIPYDQAIIDLLLKKIEWLIPYFVQIGVQHLIDLYDEKGFLDLNDVEHVYAEIISRRNFNNFESYFNRLSEIFIGEDHAIAIAILNLLSSESDQIDTNYIVEQINEGKPKCKSILDQLEFDGYIYSFNTGYQFNSPIIKYWWNSYGK